ncbi:hypothetical protein [Pedococcus bigeumensis]|uniref:hypothetical protein n=1 Tax=Pedococcus bigeumensis TaxID=433644 RepID=UPI002FE76D1D
MKHSTSDETREQGPVLPLTHLSVRELLSDLTSCEDALREDPSGVADADSSAVAADRRELLHQREQIVRELRRRRHLRGAGQAERRRSAAWPPPPW